MDKDTFIWVDWIVTNRKSVGWSQAELARRVDTTRQTINDYEERRRTQPDVLILSRISMAFGYPPEHLPRLANKLPSEPPKDETLYRIEHLYHTLKEPSSKNRALEYLEFLTQQEKKNAPKSKKPK